MKLTQLSNKSDTPENDDMIFRSGMASED